MKNTRNLIIVLLLPLFSLLIGCHRPLNLSDLPADLKGYMTVKTGQSVWLPVKPEKANRNLFSLADFFQVMAVLGHPTDSSKRLSNFSNYPGNSEIWLLLRSFQASSPKYFILQLIKEPSLPETGFVGELQNKFEAGEFIGSTGQPLVKPLPIFLYFSIAHASFFGSDLDKVGLKVGGPDHNWSLNAKIFDSQPSGDLVILFDESFDKIWKPKAGTLVKYKIAVNFVRFEDIKCRSELNDVLPDATENYLKSLLQYPPKDAGSMEIAPPASE